MSIQIMKRIIYSKHLNLHFPLKITINSVSNSQALCAKKRFTVKNKFTFRNELPRDQAISVAPELKSVSPYLHYELDENKLESRVQYDELPDPDHKLISADLLDQKSIDRQHHTKKPSQAKIINKSTLTYQGEILFGVHPVYLALLQKKRKFHRLFTRKGIDSSNEDIITLKTKVIKTAESMNIPVTYLDSRGLKMLAPGAVHQGICLDAGYLPLPMWTKDQLMNDSIEKNLLWLVLDEILDPMNVGAIIRSAFYFGVDKVFVIRGNSCKLSPTVSKASSGSLEVVNIYQIDNLEDFIKERKNCGWSIVSTLAYSENKSGLNEGASISAAEFNASNPTVLILGNEGRGISKSVLNLCDSLISIEPGQTLPEGIDSLNVSVATGVLLYTLTSKAKNIQR